MSDEQIVEAAKREMDVLRSEITKLKQINAEMLEALEAAGKGIRALLDNMEKQYPKVDPVMVTERINPINSILSKAISKAKGGKNG